MRAEELMIGNWIEWNGAEHQVDRIDFFEDLLDDGHHGFLPLTEEWLKRFKIRPMKGTDIPTWYKDGVVINKDADGNFFTYAGKKIVFPYVHTLQNFWMWYNQKELTIS